MQLHTVYTYTDEIWICSGDSASDGTSEGSGENSQNVSYVPLVYLSIQEVTVLSPCWLLHAYLVKWHLKDDIPLSRLPKYNSVAFYFSSLSNGAWYNSINNCPRGVNTTS